MGVGGTWRPAEGGAGVSGDSRGFRMTRRGPVADVTGVGRCPRVSYKGSDSRASRDYLDETYFSRRIRGTGRPCSLRSEEHTSELQSLMRISYAVFCLKKKKLIYNIYQQ